MTLIQCRGVTHAYRGGRGARPAVRELDLRCAEGEILGLVGPNGAGKTTLLRLLAGELVPTAGAVLVNGAPAASRSGRAQLGYAADPPIIPAELSGVEWLAYLAGHRARSPAERIDLVRVAVGLGELDEFVGRRAAEYSRGMILRLALAGAALCGRKVVLLDETLSGVDPLVHHRLREAIGRLAAEGRAVVLASHDLGAIERVATRAVVVWRGRLLADVALASLLAGRVLELSLNGGALASSVWLLQRFSGSVRTGGGVAVPLTGGLAAEQVLAECRAQRVPVAASRVRYRRLEDILLAAAARERGS